MNREQAMLKFEDVLRKPNDSIEMTEDLKDAFRMAIHALKFVEGVMNITDKYLDSELFGEEEEK